MGFVSAMRMPSLELMPSLCLLPEFAIAGLCPQRLLHGQVLDVFLGRKPLRLYIYIYIFLYIYIYICIYIYTLVYIYI